jgi:hypothetical protein
MYGPVHFFEIFFDAVTIEPSSMVSRLMTVTWKETSVAWPEKNVTTVTTVMTVTTVTTVT